MNSDLILTITVTLWIVSMIDLAISDFKKPYMATLLSIAVLTIPCVGAAGYLLFRNKLRA